MRMRRGSLMFQLAKMLEKTCYTLINLVLIPCTNIIKLCMSLTTANALLSMDSTNPMPRRAFPVVKHIESLT